LVISNIETLALPPKTTFSAGIGVDLRADLRILQLVFLDVGPELFRELRAREGVEPTTAASAASGVTGFMNAAFGFLLAIVIVGLERFQSKARHF